MTNDIDTLKDDYQAIKAPPHLATRVHAQVKDTPYRRFNWVPAGASLMAVVAVLWFVPFATFQTSSDDAPRKPSLTSIAALKPQKPEGVTVSLTQLRTVKRPKLPTKPRLNISKPQTRLDPDNDFLKEKDHVHS